jgi:outer membrane protein assembly factor BamE (lipoprotein component of BamABCDE complex)
MSLVCAVEGHWTVYSKGFSESAFRTLRVGMTEREVEEILGSPLRCDGWYTSDGEPEQYWSYTCPNKDMGDYWRREVEFHNGTVSQIHAYYWVD